VVKHVLAKDESGVRFSLSAPKDNKAENDPKGRFLLCAYLGTNLLIVGITDNVLERIQIYFRNIWSKLQHLGPIIQGHGPYQIFT
jgi:hypothetical protein